LEIKCNIDDNKVENFTAEAKSKLTEHSRKHLLDVISEAEKLEASLREYGATSELAGKLKNKLKSEVADLV